MEQMVNLTIDNVKVSVPAGTTVLEAAKQAGINIPTLCYLKDVNAIGACRMCVVNAGGRALQAACRARPPALTTHMRQAPMAFTSLR